MNKLMLNDIKINTIPIHENNEPLVDLKDQQYLLFGSPPDTPLTYNDYTKIRKSVYEKLLIAQNMLPCNWKFKVYEGLRSLRVQKILFNQQINRLKSQKPHRNEEELFIDASKLVCPIYSYDGTPIIPPHSTGGAVDLELIDINGNLINLGMEIKDWYKVDPDICKTHSKNISRVAFKNRMILLEIMLDLGFVNYPNEWWHFSYGDRLWAALTNEYKAIYGAIAS
ncbi:M15 family metallopeptidase [Legionella longbeachae]|uniref:D-alanyl-D-alanine dipeptidase n=1 Tax=Legionella longbeachae serogroup 1 (strain NSW150) TaxID=661367 RepID=D3HKY6_LEGLN|nr:M15 family metallopeptidase [Legionella longbeachae]VEE03614.1 D-alanyl-D-alanine dipeptidase [Legionella oakridgensis]HBD7397580.1 M15 family metallopeptidase [Legionella pneumophila]ARB93501.1 D-alanyl-D-alanine dipeptidase [Legionella longbeachae]ARM33394.1 M15 family metallopeptidase [Legionella longbeachae]QIN33314.1 D-alanyl-D-alanine dipeptidase [Legionella longbeachae]